MSQPIGSTSWPNRHRPYFVRLDALLKEGGKGPRDPGVEQHTRRTLGMDHASHTPPTTESAAPRPRDPSTPLIAIVGPGAVTRLCRPLLHDAARDSSRLRRLIGDAARYSDQLLRRIPFLPLVSLEPLELESVLTVPHKLAILDISPRVLRAVRRDLPHADVYTIDLASTPLPVIADVIIAFNVVSRIGAAERPSDRGVEMGGIGGARGRDVDMGAIEGTRDRGVEPDRAAAAMRNLVAALRPGGLLLADDRSTDRYLPPDQFEQVADKTHLKTTT